MITKLKKGIYKEGSGGKSLSLTFVSSERDVWKHFGLEISVFKTTAVLIAKDD
jgi:hypothetical protein